MLITPVLHFNGNCKEAIALYEKAFAFTSDYILYYKDASPQDTDIHKYSETELSYVYHSEGYLGTQRIIMADEIGFKYNTSTSLFLGLTFDTAEEVAKAFNIILENGGTVIYPLHCSTYSSQTGSLVDRFGFRWGMMTEQTER